MHHSAPHEPGKASQGFKRTEQRQCMSGYCWRKYEPHQPSKLWGLQYESWEFAGVTSVCAINHLLGHPARPSRIDIAFDYNVPDHLYPMQLEPLFLDRCNDKGIVIEWKGKRLEQTVYVGSQQSERRIRIYRRDLKNLLMHEEGHHILRIELELKSDAAQDFWHHLVQHGQDAAYQAASAHVAHMIGYAPIAAGWDLPEPIRTHEDAEAYQMLFQHLKQHSVMIEACNRCGIDLAKLARIRMDRSNSRTLQHRLEHKTQLLASMEPNDLERLLVVHL